MTKVLIVGAGPTGLTAGIELARRGLIPTIVDRRVSLSTLSRAVGITPRSLDLLAPSGVAQTLISEGIAMDGLRLYRGRSLVLEMALHSDRMAFPTVLGLPQDRTEAIMNKAFVALGGAVTFGLACEDIREEAGKAIVRFSDGTQEVFDFVIGADGVRSTVRQAAGIAFPGFDVDQIWSIADVDVEGWQHPNKITLVHAGPGQLLVVAPLEPTRYRLVASTPDAIKTLPLPINIVNVRREGTFNVSVRQAECYSKGPVHLAGDAAHCHTPVGGRGMNLGIADACELARRLVEGDVDGYSALRHREGREAITVTERGRKIAGGMTWQSRLAFGALIGSAKLLAPVRRRMGRFLVEF